MSYRVLFRLLSRSARWCVAVPFLIAAGCASSQFTASVTQFQQTTSTAVKAQSDQIASFEVQDTERVKTSLAAERARLVVAPQCVELIGSDKDINACQLLKDGQPLSTGVDVSNLLALGQALDNYAQAIAVLAADASADEATFSTALTGLVGKVGALDGAFAKASNTPGLPPDKLNAVGTIAAQAGVLYLEYARVSALRQIIIASDPFVQEATGFLSATSDQLRKSVMNGGYRDLRLASEDLDTAIAANATTATILAKQDAVFTAMAAYKGRAALSDGFAQLGAAHHLLAQSAAAGASGPDLLAAIVKLADASKAISQSVSTLKK